MVSTASQNGRDIDPFVGHASHQRLEVTGFYAAVGQYKDVFVSSVNVLQAVKGFFEGRQNHCATASVHAVKRPLQFDGVGRRLQWRSPSLGTEELDDTNFVVR